VAPRTGLLAVDGASRDVSSIADTHALPALAVLLVAAAVLTWWLRRSGRADQAFGALLASLASVSLIVAVTLFRSGWPQQISPGRVADWSTTGLEQLRSDPFGSSQFILNVVLFVPAGIAWTWMTRRPVVVTAALVGVFAAALLARVRPRAEGTLTARCSKKCSMPCRPSLT